MRSITTAVQLHVNLNYKRRKGWCFCWTVSERSLWYDGTRHVRPIRNFRIGASLSNRIRIVTSDSNSNLEASQVPNLGLWLRLRLVLWLVLLLVGWITRDNGLSYVVNMEYKNTMWCNVQVDPTATLHWLLFFLSLYSFLFRRSYLLISLHLHLHR